MKAWRAGTTLCAYAASAVIAVLAGIGSVADAQAAPPASDVRDPSARSERATELTERGERLVHRGDPGSAVWFLREALAVNPAHAPAAVALADIYLARGQPSDALDVAERTSTRAPGHAPLWLRVSSARSAIDDWPGAIGALREGLRHAPRDVELLRALIQACLQRGEWLPALTAQRALAALGGTASVAESVAVEAALAVLVGTNDRARGLRCDPPLSVVRRALSRCEVRP